jgi:hypothetical protein
MMQATSRYRSLHRAEARRQAALRLATVAASEVAAPAKPLRSNRAVRRHVRLALRGAVAA